ncbi:hypothetical protein D3C83_255740 [compost metagenome]
MQWPQPAETGIRDTEIEDRKSELESDQNPYQHADDAPEKGGNSKLFDNLIVVVKRIHGTHKI